MAEASVLVSDSSASCAVRSRGRNRGPMIAGVKRMRMKTALALGKGAWVVTPWMEMKAIKQIMVAAGEMDASKVMNRPAASQNITVSLFVAA